MIGCKIDSFNKYLRNAYSVPVVVDIMINKKDVARTSKKQHGIQCPKSNSDAITTHLQEQW